MQIRKNLGVLVMVAAAGLMPLQAHDTGKSHGHSKAKKVKKSASVTRIWNDSTRLQALLLDVNSSAMVSAAGWRTVANEANAVANRLYANSGSWAAARPIARDARLHVREMHAAALKGDAAGARAHAKMALPFVNQLVDWSADKLS